MTNILQHIYIIFTLSQLSQLCAQLVFIFGQQSGDGLTQEDGANAPFDLCQVIAEARATARAQQTPGGTGQKVDALSVAECLHAENQQPNLPDLHPKGKNRSSLTPELDGGVKLDSSGATPEVTSPKLFPIFRPKTQWKVMWVILAGFEAYARNLSMASLHKQSIRGTCIKNVGDVGQSCRRFWEKMVVVTIDLMCRPFTSSDMESQNTMPPRVLAGPLRTPSFLIRN